MEEMKMHISKRAWALCLAVVASLAFAACGGSDDNSSTETAATGGNSASSNPGGVPGNSAGMDRAVGGAKGEAAAKAAKAAVDAFGGPVDLPKGKVIGLVNVTGQSEAAQRLQKGAEDAVKSIGWTIKTVDAQGDPAKSQAGIQGFVTQKVDAIIDLSNPTQAITQGLAAAGAAKIPVINIGGPQDPSPNIQAQFHVDETPFTKALNAYMLKKLPSDAKIMTFVFPLLLSERLRDDQLKADLEGTNIKVVAKHTIDFSDAVADSQKAVRAALSANPGLSAVWSDTDTTLPPTGTVLNQVGKCGDVQSYSFYDDLANMAQIRKGCATAIVTSPVDSDGWAAVDSLAEMWARNKGLDSLPKGWNDLKDKYGVDIRNGTAISIVDKDNLPPKGKYVEPSVDFVTFFKTKWAEEFGVK
jgi:ribose transport system substrate-binding protein